MYGKREEKLKGQACCESFGQLVRLGFDIAAFTPASYQRHRL